MPDWHPYQTSFNGGEVSIRMLNRMDLNQYSRSVLQMRNWMPTLQGPAIRAPGSTYLKTMETGTEDRVIPFHDFNGDRRVLVLSDEAYQLVGTDVTNPRINATEDFRQQIVENNEFRERSNWSVWPEWFTSKDGAGLGVRYLGPNVAPRGAIQGVCRLWKYPNVDNVTFLIDGTAVVPYQSDNATISYDLDYVDNPGIDGQEHELTLQVGTSFDDNDIWEEKITGPLGSYIDTVNVSLPPAFTGTLYIRIRGSAEEYASTPVYNINEFSILTDVDPATIPPQVDDTSPYAQEDLDDVQYVQSPYGQKPIVFVHPKYPPHWFYFDTGVPGYVFEPIPFVGTPPPEWVADNYPSVCTAYQGRLILAATPLESETVWCSKPGQWDDFTEGTAGVADGIEFTSIFRSPVTWANGHKDLIVGSEDYEYIVQHESGVIQQSDIDVRLHSTHGARGVQAVGMGYYVAFAAERGTRLRAAQLNRDNEGWVAPDLTLLADHITRVGIKRLARMRNPHQMIVCLLNSGNLGIYHEDSFSDVAGWSTLDVGGEIIDIMSQPTSRGGEDVLYMLVRRPGGIYLEAILDWRDEATWYYMASHRRYAFEAPTSVIPDLDHLEGQRVQVLADNRDYMGTFEVVGGQVELYREVSTAVAGLQMDNGLTLLPPMTAVEVGGLSAKKRYAEISVRVLGGTRPLINGQRVNDRNPQVKMDRSQPVDFFNDNTITNLDWDELALINISQDVPLECDITAVHGKLASKSL